MEVLTSNVGLIQAHFIKNEPELEIRNDSEGSPELYTNYSVSKEKVKVESFENFHYGNVDVAAESLEYQNFSYEESIRDEYLYKSQEADDLLQQTTYEYKEPEENFISVDDLKVEILFPGNDKENLKISVEGKKLSSLFKNEELLDNADENDNEEDDVIFLEDDEEVGVEVDWPDLDNGKQEFDWPDLDNGKQEFECYLCNKKVVSNYNLRRHMMIHTGERPFGCDICFKKFREFSDLKKHRRVHADDEGYKCLVCHRNTPSEKNATKCDSCGQEDKQHKIPYGSIYLDEATIMKGSSKKAFVCPVCDRIFGSRHNLKRHYMIHTGEKPYKCDLCGNRFREVSTLKKHKLTHSRINIFNCAKCGAQFNDFRNYNRHKNVHLDKKKGSLSIVDKEEVTEYLFECRECTEKFPSSATYKEHLKVHSPDESFQCSICGVIYRTMEKLQAHFITHNGSSEENDDVNADNLVFTYNEPYEKTDPIILE